VAGGCGIEGERRRGRGGQGEERRGSGAGGALGANWRGAAGNGEVGGKIGGIGKKRREGVGVAGKGVRALEWHCRSVSALPIGSCCTRASTGAPTHLLGSSTRRCGPVFGPQSNFRADHFLGGVLGPPVEML
jgi:hypothetical protein